MVVNCAPQSLCGTAIVLHLLTAMPMAWANEDSVATPQDPSRARVATVQPSPVLGSARRLAAPNKSAPPRHEQVSHDDSETGTLQGSGMVHVHPSWCGKPSVSWHTVRGRAVL